MRVVFLGTPDFGVPSLKALMGAGHEIVAVFTQPDRPRGRGHKVTCCPVKTAATEMGLPVYSPERIRDDESVTLLRELKPQAMVTAAYGQILSQRILDVPTLGCVNVHGSLLPAYRGPAPVQWALINGETCTGVTTMLTARGVDTGPILLQEKVSIGPEETACELMDRLALVGAGVLTRTLMGLLSGTLTPVPQDETQATRFPMLGREDGCIDWQQPAQAIVNRIRGVIPWPGAYTTAGDMVLKIWKAEAWPGTAEAQPGTVLCDDPSRAFIVATGEGRVCLRQVQTAGRSVMNAADFLRGHSLGQGRVLGI